MLEHGRKLIFLEREPEAQATLAALLAIRPDHPEALVLMDRAREKQAARAVARGDASLASNDLAEAMAAYLEAEDFVPEFGPAVAGEKAVREAVDKLQTRAQRPAGVVLSAPWLATAMRVPPLKRLAAKVLLKLAPALEKRMERDAKVRDAAKATLEAIRH